MNIHWAIGRRDLARGGILLCFVFSLGLLGCGAGQSKVTGTVTYDGKPVAGGTLVFAPVGGGAAPASVEVGADGSYSAKTAVVGQNRLMYNAPPPVIPPGYVPKPSVQGPVSPYNNLVPKEKEVTIKAGANTINVELVRPGK